MCSIYGAVGPASRRDYMFPTLDALARNASDRGRDGHRSEVIALEDGRFVAVLGNWRATPTPEIERAPLQPYKGLVHNGTIANDSELLEKISARGGLQELRKAWGTRIVDSMILAEFLDRSSLQALACSLSEVRGSYALACENGRTVFLATNYKPLHYWLDQRGPVVYFSSMERHFTGVVPPGQRPQVLAPYTAMDLGDMRTVSLYPKDGEEKSVVVIASSGLDSTVAATRLKRQGYKVKLLHFDYGCRATPRELDAIRRIAKALDCELGIHSIASSIFGSNSRLLNDSAIAAGVEGAEYAHEWVPARNFVMIALATAYAEAGGYHAVALGNNLEEAGAYPDNEEQFTTLLNAAVPYAVRAGYRMEILAPVGNLMKHEIVKLGIEIGAPLEYTWSCYQAGDVPCGECGPCFMRREAFKRNGVIDPTASDSKSEFWQA